MAKKSRKRVKSRKSAKRVKSRKAATGAATESAGYKGHRKGSLAERLRKVYDEKGEEAAKALAARLVEKEGASPHTFRSFFSLWGRKVVPGSGKPRGRDKPVKRVKSTKATGGRKRVKSVKAVKKTAKKSARKAAKKAAPRPRVRSVKAETAAQAAA